MNYKISIAHSPVNVSVCNPVFPMCNFRYRIPDKCLTQQIPTPDYHDGVPHSGYCFELFLGESSARCPSYWTATAVRHASVMTQALSAGEDQRSGDRYNCFQ